MGDPKVTSSRKTAAMPSGVRWALLCLWSRWAVSALQVAVVVSVFHSFGTGFRGWINAAWLPLQAFLIVLVGRRNNVARMLLAVFVLLSLAQVPQLLRALTASANVWTRVDLVGVALGIVGIVLLFTASGDWFEARSTEH